MWTKAPIWQPNTASNSIPSLKVFKNGKVDDELVGLASKSQLRALLSR